MDLLASKVHLQMLSRDHIISRKVGIALGIPATYFETSIVVPCCRACNEFVNSFFEPCCHRASLDAAIVSFLLSEGLSDDQIDDVLKRTVTPQPANWPRRRIETLQAIVLDMRRERVLEKRAEDDDVFDALSVD